jgi:hypothetical protein
MERTQDRLRFTELIEQLHDVLGRFRIEAGDGLVCEKDRRILEHGTSDCDPLQFAATQRASHPARQMSEIEILQDLHRFVGLFVGESIKPAAQGIHAAEPSAHDVFENAETLHEMQTLEDGAYLLSCPPQFTARLAVTLDGLAIRVQFHFAAIRTNQSQQAPHGQRFARAARPEYTDQLARANVKADVFQQASSAGDGLRQILRCKYRHAISYFSSS